MLRNYFTSAFRNILRNSQTSFINIAGLGLAMACCIMIFLYISDEVSYDQYHSKSDRIYRITRDFISQDGITNLRLANVALLMILMPAALHPWYVILIIPFLAFYPSAAWLLFSCTVVLSYLKYVPPEGKMPVLILVTEYIPLFALLTAGYILNKTADSNETAGLEFSNQKEDTAGV